MFFESRKDGVAPVFIYNHASAFAVFVLVRLRLATAHEVAQRSTWKSNLRFPFWLVIVGTKGGVRGKDHRYIDFAVMTLPGRLPRQS